MTIQEFPIARALVALTSLFLVSQASVAETIEGTVDFEQRIEIQSFSRSTVTQVHAKVGDRVPAGAVLIELDSTKQQAKIEIVENRVAKLQIAVNDADAAFARQQELFDRGSLSLLLYEESENTLKKAQLDLASAKAMLKKARYRLSQTQLASPVDAIVIDSKVYPGMVIHPEWTASSNEPLMTLASDGRYVVEAAVSLDIWERLAAKQSVEVVVLEKSYPAAVVIHSLFAYPYIDGNPGYILRFSFTESDRLLLPATPAAVNFD